MAKCKALTGLAVKGLKPDDEGTFWLGGLELNVEQTLT